MRTTQEQFRRWLDAPEGASIEFKSARNNFHFEKLLEYCVALANAGGGQILLGVTDRRPRDVVGTQAFAEPNRTEAGLHQRLGHPIPIEEYRHEGRRVLIVHVPARLPGTAWNIDGRYLMRAGDDLIPLGDAKLKSMFEETGPDFSAQVCVVGIGDLSPEALAEFRARWARKSGNPRIATLPVEQVLADAELLVDGQLTFAALILLGTRTALGRHLAQAEIVFEYRSSEASGPAQDRVEYREGFFLFHDRLWDDWTGGIKFGGGSIFGNTAELRIAPGVGKTRHASNQTGKPQLFGQIKSPSGHLLGFLNRGRLQQRKVAHLGIKSGIFLIGR